MLSSEVNIFLLVYTSKRGVKSLIMHERSECGRWAAKSITIMKRGGGFRFNLNVHRKVSW